MVELFPYLCCQASGGSCRWQAFVGVYLKMKIIAHIENDYKEKFGIPRQSGLEEETLSKVVMEKEYGSMDAFHGLEEYSYIWLLWLFDVPESTEFQATVRPPRLGGNERRGVFATRSPFRPNSIGLTCVKLVSIQFESGTTKLCVQGADLKDGTRIIDIKPYLAYADARMDAGNGFAQDGLSHRLAVVYDEAQLSCIPESKRKGLLRALELDPRPSYQEDPQRVYGMKYAAYNVRFRVEGNSLYIVQIDAML